jgi:hypothetical protein
MNCRICKNPITTKGFYPALAERLTKSKVCHTCDSWVSLWQRRNNADSIRIGGVHYMLTDEGGFPATIRKGHKLMEINLMHQGTIPEAFKTALADNAVFATRITVR